MRINNVIIVTGGGIGLLDARAARVQREAGAHHARFVRAKGMGPRSVRARAVEHLFPTQVGERVIRAAKERVARAKVRIRDTQDGERGRVEKGYRHSTIPTGKVQMRAGAARQAHGQEIPEAQR